MSQLLGYPLAGTVILLSVLSKQLPAIHRGGLPRDLLVAFTGIRGAQFMEALDAVGVQQVASRADLPLDEIDVAFSGLEQVATALRGDRRRMQQCLAQTFADRYPAWCGGASAATRVKPCSRSVWRSGSSWARSCPWGARVRRLQRFSPRAVLGLTRTC